MIIIGCDLHTRFEQIAMVETETGQVIEKRLDHESDEARSFYEGLSEPALVGIEATGATRGWRRSFRSAVMRRTKKRRGTQRTRTSTLLATCLSLPKMTSEAAEACWVAVT